MFGLFKNFTRNKTNSLRKGMNNNADNNNHNHNNMNNGIFIPLNGIYAMKSTLKSQQPVVIRIIGQKKDDITTSITFDGKEIPNYVLERQYVLVEGYGNVKKNVTKSLLDGIGALDDVDNPNPNAVDLEVRTDYDYGKKFADDGIQTINAHATVDKVSEEYYLNEERNKKEAERRKAKANKKWLDFIPTKSKSVGQSSQPSQSSQSSQSSQPTQTNNQTKINQSKPIQQPIQPTQPTQLHQSKPTISSFPMEDAYLEKNIEIDNPHKIKVSFELNIPYNIEKIRQAITLLGLNKDYLITQLMETIGSDDVMMLISNVIKNELEKVNVPIIEQKPVEPVKPKLKSSIVVEQPNNVDSNVVNDSNIEDAVDYLKMHNEMMLKNESLEPFPSSSPSPSPSISDAEILDGLSDIDEMLKGIKKF